MRRLIFLQTACISCFVVLLFFAACGGEDENDNIVKPQNTEDKKEEKDSINSPKDETVIDSLSYARQREQERQAISDYILNQKITIISEDQFKAQNYQTDVSKNEFVLLSENNIYMQIVSAGCGSSLQNGNAKNVLVRFLERNLLDSTLVISNFENPSSLDKMTVLCQGNNYLASFTEGLMFSSYGASVPAGWLVVFPYIKIGRQTSDEPIAKVRLIIPHTLGHQYSTAHVIPYYYEITFQEERV